MQQHKNIWWIYPLYHYTPSTDGRPIRLKSLIHLCFSKKIGGKIYKYIAVGREKIYFVKHHSESKNKYTEEDVIQMLEFFIDNIFVQFGGLYTNGIPIRTNCVPLLADLFIHSY